MSELPPVNEASQTSSALRQREVRIATGSRLHFGLFDTVDPFGGVGVMIARPVTEVVVATAERFDYHGPRSSHAAGIARRIAEFAGLDRPMPACRIDVLRQAPAHLGLGSGTQLSMAVAEGICRCLGIAMDSVGLATRIAARGKRSAVGIHGYFQGGLILESSGQPGQLNEIQQRVELPDSWCVAILCPTSEDESVHGVEEAEKFARLAAGDPTAKRELTRIACQDLMPAAVAGDFHAWSSAISQFNRSSGMLFAPIQGGPYNGGKVQALIQWLIDRGVHGVGQSSWGPGVFAWFESPEHAEPVIRRMPEGVQLIALTRTKNDGRTLKDPAESS